MTYHQKLLEGSFTGYQSVNCVQNTYIRHFVGLVQERHNSIASTLELRLSCTNPLIYSHIFNGWWTKLWLMCVQMPKNRVRWICFWGSLSRRRVRRTYGSWLLTSTCTTRWSSTGTRGQKTVLQTGALLLTKINLNPSMEKVITSIRMGGMKLSIPKLHWCSCWNLEMDEWFHSTFYWACDYMSMLRLKLNHINS